ncbi:MAG: 2-hydroxyacyl-CoA dehydratase [Armatimonadota bacterium]|nr:MAG: 2-hydroxyacyl-CoA dehydratase [Armatimonadota bacterium]
MNPVGITTTVPIEIIYATGRSVVDLNNVFITSADPGDMLDRAELAGFPRTLCGWIKGIYTTALDLGLTHVVAVTQGDCANTCALMETLADQGIEIIPFAYPYDRDRDLLALQIEKVRQHFGAAPEAVADAKRRLDVIRAKAHRIDALTWQSDAVTGKQNHYYQITCSDMKSDPSAFERELDGFLAGISDAAPLHADRLRLGYIGVPPIVTDLYDHLEALGARVVFNETQRQFAMPFDTTDLVEQYRLYTYPYGVFWRLRDIKAEVERRRIEGIIHYAQNFCFHQIEDLIVRRHLSVPILTLEGDRPGPMDAGMRLRVESFVEMLRHARRHAARSM